MMGFENTRASDVKQVLEKIADGKEISTKINSQYSTTANLVIREEELTRQFDIVYSLDGLTVFVEAELARKKYSLPLNYSDYLVTPKEQTQYNRQRTAKEKRVRKSIMYEDGSPIPEGEDISKLIKGNKPLILPSEFGLEDYGLKFIEGPLVDDPNDTELTTARVKSVLTQYDGLDLYELETTDKSWKQVIEVVKNTGNLQTGLRCGGIREFPHAVGNDYHTHYSDEDAGYRPTDMEKKVVFMKTVLEKRDLEKAIYTVYIAGSIVNGLNKATTENGFKLHLAASMSKSI